FGGLAHRLHLLDAVPLLNNQPLRRLAFDRDDLLTCREIFGSGCLVDRLRLWGELFRVAIEIRYVDQGYVVNGRFALRMQRFDDRTAGGGSGHKRQRYLIKCLHSSSSSEPLTGSDRTS